MDFSHSSIECYCPKSNKPGNNMLDSLAFFEYCQVSNHLTWKDNVSLGLTSTGCREKFLKFCEIIHSRFKFFRKQGQCLSTSNHGPTYTNDGNFVYFHPFRMFSFHPDDFRWSRGMGESKRATFEIFSADREKTNDEFVQCERNLSFDSNHYLLGRGQLTKEGKYIQIALDRGDLSSVFAKPVCGLEVQLISDCEGQMKVEKINFPVVIPAEVLLEFDKHQKHKFSISPGGNVVAWILEFVDPRRLAYYPEKFRRGCFYHANTATFVHFWLPSFDKVGLSSSCFSANGELFSAITYQPDGKRAQNAALQIWNTVSGALIQKIQLQNSIETEFHRKGGIVEYFFTADYSLAPDGETIVFAPSYKGYMERHLNEILIYDVKSGNILYHSIPPQQSPPFRCKFKKYNLTSFDICSSGRGLLKLYDIQGGIARTCRYGNIFYTSGKCLVLEDLRTGQNISEHYLIGDTNKYNHVKCSPTNDAEFLLACIPNSVLSQSFADVYKWIEGPTSEVRVSKNHEWRHRFLRI